MRILELDRKDPTLLPTKVLVELVRHADGSVRATWHDEGYRQTILNTKPGVVDDAGDWVELTTPELLHRYAAKLYAQSQVFAVLEP